MEFWRVYFHSKTLIVSKSSGSNDSLLSSAGTSLCLSEDECNDFVRGFHTLSAQMIAKQEAQFCNLLDTFYIDA